MDSFEISEWAEIPCSDRYLVEDVNSTPFHYESNSPPEVSKCQPSGSLDPREEK